MSSKPITPVDENILKTVRKGISAEDFIRLADLIQHRCPKNNKRKCTDYPDCGTCYLENVLNEEVTLNEN